MVGLRLKSGTLHLIFSKQDPLEMTVIAPVKGGVRVALKCDRSKVEISGVLHYLETGCKHLCSVSGGSLPLGTLVTLKLMNNAIAVGPGFQFDAEIFF